MPDNLSYKVLFRSRNYTERRITRQEKQQPTALRGDATDLAQKPLAYRLARMAAIRIKRAVAASGRTKTASAEPTQHVGRPPTTVSDRPVAAVELSGKLSFNAAAQPASRR